MTKNFYGLGNAIVDTEYRIDDDFLIKHNIAKGCMMLIDQEQRDSLLAALPERVNRCCGGSAANTMMAIKQMGGQCFYSCRVAGDEAGQFFLQDLAKQGVQANLHLKARQYGEISATSLILLTPDSERSMCTHLGISEYLATGDLDTDVIKQADWIYIEGYLASSASATKAAVLAHELALNHAVKTAITLSDVSMVTHFRPALEAMMGDGVDLLFCNEQEALAWTCADNLEAAVRELQSVAVTFVITRGAQGALIFDGVNSFEVSAPQVRAVNTNGAGDTFAGVFLHSVANGSDYRSAAALANEMAAHVVTSDGARLRLPPKF